MAVYTDIAEELYGPRRGSVPPGVRCTTARTGQLTITRVQISVPGLARPMGRYVLFETPALPALDSRDERLIGALARELKALLPAAGPILVVGVGNRRVTADSLGPRTAGQILVTRGMAAKASQGLGLREVACVIPGVAARTGLTLAELLSGVVARLRPAAVLCVDSLTASEPGRIGRSIQLTDTGLCPAQPGSSHCVTAGQLGVPVLAMGLPTLMDADELAGCKGLVVAPRELDAVVEKGAQLLAMGINRALQERLTLAELHYLVN